MAMIFDTHAHYDHEAFDGDRDQVLGSLSAHGIGLVVNVGADLPSSQMTLGMTKKYSFVYGAVGVHPSEAGGMDETAVDWLKCAASDEKIVAIGEIGLDYHWSEPWPEVQKSCFVRQLGLARELGLPVIIHSRDAAKDTLDIMKEHGKDLGGVIHCFSYSLEVAREYADMGYYIGVGGVLTFKNARKLREVVAYLPMDRIVLETDCPYLAPEPNRGRRNTSLSLPYVVEAISGIKQIPPEEVISITDRNARDMYHIK